MDKGVWLRSAGCEKRGVVALGGRIDWGRWSVRFKYMKDLEMWDGDGGWNRKGIAGLKIKRERGKEGRQERGLGWGRAIRNVGEWVGLVEWVC